MQNDVQPPFGDGFSATGHPVHTRSLEVELIQAEDGRVRASGRILDLRKHGFVPTGGDLQMSGFIHLMCLEALVDPVTRIVEVLEPSQPVVAFEASPRTGGESCRDIAHHLQDLVGECLDDDFVKKLSGCFGGPLGCSHLLTLTQLLASTVRGALDLESDSAPQHAARSIDERIFKRCLVLDGFEQGNGKAMAVTVQQNDIHTRPFAEVESPLDRFLFQREVRVLAKVDMRSMTFVEITGEERARDRDGLADVPWQSLADVLAPLVDQPALYGLSRLLLTRFAGQSERGPMLDALLNIAPGLIQCMAAMAHRLVEGRGSGEPDAHDQPTILQLGGLSDSCYIWRAGGPGNRLRGGGGTDT